MNVIQDQDKIKPYNATKYLHQMKYLPDITPLCAVILVLVIIFLIAIPIGGGNIFPPDAKYSHPEPSGDEIPNIFINRKGYVFLNSSEIEAMHLPEAIAERRKEMKVKDVKMLLTADAEAPWGKVIDVMNSLIKSEIQVVGLITDRHFSVLDATYQRQLHGKKGLRLPESAR